MWLRHNRFRNGVRIDAYRGAKQASRRLTLEFLERRDLLSGLVLMADHIYTRGSSIDTRYSDCRPVQGGNGGNIDLRTGWPCDPGDGRGSTVLIGGQSCDVQDVDRDATLTGGEYFFRQVANQTGREGFEQVTLTVTGDVVIHTQFLFSAYIDTVFDSAKGALPSVTIYAGEPYRFSSQIHEYEPDRHYLYVNSNVESTFEEAGSTGMASKASDGGNVTFYTSEPGDLEYDNISTSGGDGCGGADGGVGGNVTFVAWDASIHTGWSIDIRGGNGGFWYDNSPYKEGNGGRGGSLRAVAKDAAIHSVDLGGGSGRGGGDGGAGGGVTIRAESCSIMGDAVGGNGGDTSDVRGGGGGPGGSMFIDATEVYASVVCSGGQGGDSGFYAPDVTGGMGGRGGVFTLANAKQARAYEIRCDGGTGGKGGRGIERGGNGGDGGVGGIVELNSPLTNGYYRVSAAGGDGGYGGDDYNYEPHAGADGGRGGTGGTVRAAGEDIDAHPDGKPGKPKDGGASPTETNTSGYGEVVDRPDLSDLVGPPTHAVVVLPGICGTFPAASDYEFWCLNRGVAQSLLEIDPLANTYTDLIRTLENVGYVPNRTLFVANYDWRLAPGPYDQVEDGRISEFKVTSIPQQDLSGEYQYGVDYLGFTLKKAAQAFKEAYRVPLKAVDIIAHSTGGLVARCYIQSEAYNGILNETTRDRLPGVRKFVMFDVPNQGAPKAWNLFNDDFCVDADAVYPFFLRSVMNSAFQKVMSGNVVHGKDGDIGFREITPNMTDAERGVFAGEYYLHRKWSTTQYPEPSQAKEVRRRFISLYVPTIQALLPTYAFLDNGGSDLDDINDHDNPARNALLLDLNGRIGLLCTRVDEVVNVFGNGEDTINQNTLIEGPLGPYPFVQTFDHPVPRLPGLHEKWYSPSRDPHGDKTVPLESLVGLFLTSYKDWITNREFVSNASFGSGDQIHGKSLVVGGKIDHCGIVSNPYVQQEILRLLLGVEVPFEKVSTGANTGGNTGDMVYEIQIDPVSAVLVDSSGRRLGYSNENGPVAEIPGSQYYGGANGIGYFIASTPDTYSLQITGQGDDYLVECSSSAGNSRAGLVLQGSLNPGQVLSVVVPQAIPSGSPPQANDEAATTVVNTPVRLRLLANDVAASGLIDPSSITLIAAPQAGKVSIDRQTGEATYSPPAGFLGDDSFSYRVSDGSGVASNTAVVRIHVVEGNQPPSAVDDIFTMEPNTTLAAAVLSNDSDPENSLDPGSVRIVAPPRLGSAHVDPVSGEITYIPPPDYQGAVVIRYTVRDSGLAVSNEASVTILVGEALALAPIENQAVDEQTALQFAAHIVDQDPSRQTLNYSLDTASIALGMQIESTSGEFTWTPAKGRLGRYTVTITVTDNGVPQANLTDTETFTITVGGVANLPARKSGYNVLLRHNAKDPGKLELVDAKNFRNQYWTAPADRVFKLTVRGLTNLADTLTVDCANRPLAIEDGVVFDGKGGKGTDALVLKNSAKRSRTDDHVTIAEDRVIFNDTPYILQGVENVSVDTGAGNDTIAISSLGTNVTLIDSAGTEILDFSQANSALTLNLAATSAQKIFARNRHTLTLRGVFEDVIGTPYADLIKGNSAANKIWGGAGNDTIYGGGGNDTLYGEGGDDWLYGEAGNDFLYGGPGNNVLLGGDGNDVLDVATGVPVDSPGRNLLIGGSGRDSLRGGSGEEILIGGTTKYDKKVAALAAVMREWTSDKPFADRCPDPLAGFIQLKKKDKSNPKGTVIDDKVRDQLFGGGGSNWFLNFATDEVG